MSHTLTNGPFTVIIVIQGTLNPRRTNWFEEMTLTSRPDGNTNITGTVADQAALFALISRIRNLGLKLISINRADSLPDKETQP